jgi:hypothetical protein
LGINEVAFGNMEAGIEHFEQGIDTSPKGRTLCEAMAAREIGELVE